MATKKKEEKKDPKDYKKRSGCTLVENHQYDGENKGTGPMLYGWRFFEGKFMKFNAYLSKDMGRPQSGEHKDECLVFVVNIEVEGLGQLPPQSAVWSKKYKKLTMKGGLVANPNAPRGGYWGPGGERRKKYVNQ